MDPRKQLEALLDKYRNNQCTEEEKHLLFNWLEELDRETAETTIFASDAEAEETGEKIWNTLQPQLKRTNKPLMRKILPVILKAAAIILLAVTAGLVFYNRYSVRGITTSTQASKNEILPGSNKAVLTLHNGQRIVLTDAQNGALARQGNTQVIKLDSMLTYNAGDAAAIEPVYNTITTPRGGQYLVVLSDGTRVWLNSASSLRFPAVFTGDERRVSITGEVYFEVAKNVGNPFWVDVDKKQAIRVTGTHFNVMAYADEPAIETTLLEGAVTVHRGDQVLMLKPGQQSQLSAAGKLSLVQDADTEAVIAWKNGQTLFVASEIRSIMRQVSRWYDVEVEYRGTVPARTFTGGISRKSNLDGLLKILRLSDIHFTVENRKIIVTP